MRQVPHLNEQYAENLGKGLHIFSIYRQMHSLKEVEGIVEKMKIKWPVALDGHWGNRYRSLLLPRVWLIGTDGKFKYIGGGKGYDKILAKELAKIKYPGLGLSKVHESLEPAAKAYVAGEMSKAYRLAEAVYDQDEVSDEAEEQAEAIMERVAGTCNSYMNTAEVGIAERDYARARIALKVLTTRYKGVEEAEDAPAMLKKLTEKAGEVERELTARRALLVLTMKFDVAFQDVDQSDLKAMNKWRADVADANEELAKEHKGTAAAVVAADRTDWFRAVIKAAIKAAAKVPDKPDDGKKAPGKDDSKSDG